MKKRFHYIVWLLCMPFAFAACEKIEPELFDGGANGAYFDYEYAADFNKTLNFGDHIVDNPDTVSVMLKVKLLGYLMEEKRTLSVKTKDIEGYELADVTIDEVVFADNEYEKEIEIKVKRPEVEDSLYAVCIYLDGSGDLGSGISGKNEINLYVTESYEKPAIWYSHVETYLGAWSKEKQIFLAKHTGNNHFYQNLYDNNMGMHLFDSILALNVSAVNALLTSEPSEPILVDFPIAKDTDSPNYTVPYFWAEYEDLLGAFRAIKFCRVVAMLGGSNTRDIVSLFTSDAAVEMMTKEAANFHKDDVLFMLDEYYNNALTGCPIADFRNLFWVKLDNSANYKVRIPYWWEDRNAFGTAEIVKMYFGEYSDDKYQFMLKSVLKEDGADDFIAASLLPFVYDKNNDTYAWDNSPFGVKQLSGEERLKECYRIIKAANDKRPLSRQFDIPDVDLD